MSDTKTTAEYTPGPWHVVPYDAGDVPHWSGVPSISASEELDCGIVHWAGFAQEYWRSARGDKEIQANARLIAAAPELLEALKYVLSSHGKQFHDALDQAKKAIAKAEGRVT